MWFSGPENRKSIEFQLIREMGLQHVAWNYALSRHLRKQDPVQDLKGLITEKEIEHLNGN